jgi:hypothetical protein
MPMKSQDIAVLLGLALPDWRGLNYASLAARLRLSTSETHAAVKRGIAAGLVADGQSRRPLAGPLKEFLVHGMRYAFPPVLGGSTRGVPTAYAAPSMRDAFGHVDGPPPVWPHAGANTIRGLSFEPLYKRAPEAALADSRFHELLALVDALRGGRARERKLAAELLDARLSEYLK